MGDRVTHDKHGLGRVVAVQDETSVIVDFGGTRRRVMSPYSTMTKL